MLPLPALQPVIHLDLLHSVVVGRRGHHQQVSFCQLSAALRAQEEDAQTLSVGMEHSEPVLWCTAANCLLLCALPWPEGAAAGGSCSSLWPHLAAQHRQPLQAFKDVCGGEALGLGNDAADDLQGVCGVESRRTCGQAASQAGSDCHAAPACAHLIGDRERQVTPHLAPATAGDCTSPGAVGRRYAGRPAGQVAARRRCGFLRIRGCLGRRGWGSSLGWVHCGLVSGTLWSARHCVAPARRYIEGRGRRGWAGVLDGACMVWRQHARRGGTAVPPDGSPAYRSATKAAPYSSTAVSANGAKSKSRTSVPPSACSRATACAHASVMAAGEKGRGEKQGPGQSVLCCLHLGADHWGPQGTDRGPEAPTETQHCTIGRPLGTPHLAALAPRRAPGRSRPGRLAPVPQTGRSCSGCTAWPGSSGWVGGRWGLQQRAESAQAWGMQKLPRGRAKPTLLEALQQTAWERSLWHRPALGGHLLSRRAPPALAPQQETLQRTVAAHPRRRRSPLAAPPRRRPPR